MTSPSGYDPSAYPRFAVTADAIVFTWLRGEIHVVLVQRRNDPHRGRWALPGGFVDADEDLADAAARELAEETGIRIPKTSLRQLGAYGRPDRDPRMRVVTVAFWTIQPDVSGLTAGSDAASADLVAVEDALAEPRSLAFDHHQILSDALAAARPGLVSGT